MNFTKININYILIPLFFILVISLCFVQSMRWVGGHTDTAFFTEIVESMANSGKPMSQLQVGTHEAMRTWRTPVDQVCELPLSVPIDKKVNQFRYHSYFILYAIAPLAEIIEPDVLLPCLTVISFMALLFIAYIVLRDKGVSTVASLLFCLLVSVHPAWSLSIFGELYVDRFFMPLAAVYLYMLLQDKRNLFYLFIVGLICVSVVERSGLMLGIFTIAYALVNNVENKKNNKSIAIIGFIYLAIALLLMVFFVDQKGYGQQSRHFIDSIVRIATGVYDEKLMIFLYFAFSIAIFLFFRIRLLLLVLLMMAPNILGNIGGAEKVGWLSHYHSFYFPFLVVLSAIGFSDIYVFFSRVSKVWVVYVSITAIILLVVFSDPYRLNNYKLENISNYSFIRSSELLYDYFSMGNNSTLEVLALKEERLNAVLPKQSIVTSVSSNIPAIYNGRYVYFYPVNIDIAGFAIVSAVHASEREIYYTGAVSYHGDESTRQLNMCLTERLKKSGYDLQVPLVINDSVILTRGANNYNFGSEILKNENFDSGTNEWIMAGNVAYTNGRSVLINKNNFLSQWVDVEGGSIYKVSLSASCDDTGTKLQLQVNWYDDKSQFITFDSTVESCLNNNKMHEIYVVSPKHGKFANFYVLGASDTSVVVDSVSFKQRFEKKDN